jgi:hypothetical protein
MLRAVYSGLPVVRVGRGNTEGFVPLPDDLLYRRLEPDLDEGPKAKLTSARAPRPRVLLAQRVIEVARASFPKRSFQRYPRIMHGNGGRAIEGGRDSN